ncbi:peroxiredoxin [Streptomyces sp. SID3212]|uniref:redoxin domain-containing protein n=1 Tax=Streptomyces sp. SID3212 TaxID=2690259 RepID=UPI00136AEA0A|nr:redoxin domain-containing protein [Streptomyces sp. SID3212]
MLTVGDTFPSFELTACVSLEKGAEFEEINHKTYEGKWKIFFAWPKDFTFVCPTEIAAFGRLAGEFADRDAQVLGFSGDSEYVHHAWRKDHPDLRDLPFPMLADSRHELMRELGIEDADGFARRAVFVVDPSDEIQFSMVTAGSVGRNPKEVLRVLDALQTDELCPCNWTKGDRTLDAAALLSGE